MTSENSIWVCGEALIDLVPNSSGVALAKVGGGPANSAKTLANLGNPTSFIGGISQDSYGEMIAKELCDYGVGLTLALRSSLPTAIAKVELDKSGAAKYEFSLSGTATFEFSKDWLPRGNPRALYIGGLATIIDPGAEAIFEWAKGLNTPIIFDPNVRPSVIADSIFYRERFERWVGIASIVKLSLDDLSFLYPQVANQNQLMRRLLSSGPSAIILTKGESGISAVTVDATIDLPAMPVEVVDTVGAGDVVGAIIAEAVGNYGLREFTEKRLSEALVRAARAAAITCSKVGAEPPKASELG